MITLDTSVQMVILKFNLLSIDQIPFIATYLDLKLEKTKSEHRGSNNSQSEHRGSNNSDRIASAEVINNCSFASFIEQLEAASYTMTQSFYHKRPHAKHLNRSGFYYAVSFLFYRKDFAYLSCKFNEKYSIIRAGLQDMCTTRLWNAKIFPTLFRKNGQLFF